MLDISNMVFGDHILCCSGILESILWLPLKCIIYIIGFSSNCSTSNRKVYGSISTKQSYSHCRNKMVIFVESRSLQLEGAFLITIFVHSDSNSVYVVGIITIVKAFYHQGIHHLAAILLSHTTQMISAFVFYGVKLYD